MCVRFSDRRMILLTAAMQRKCLSIDYLYNLVYNISSSWLILFPPLQCYNIIVEVDSFTILLLRNHQQEMDIVLYHAYYLFCIRIHHKNPNPVVIFFAFAYHYSCFRLHI